MTNAIITERLTKHYGGRRVVDTLSLRVPKGSIYGLLGRNGAGKSTLIKMLMGMVRPDSGSARLLGEDTSNISNAARARIAYLAEGHPLYGWMSIDDAVQQEGPRDHERDRVVPVGRAAIIEGVRNARNRPSERGLRSDVVIGWPSATIGLCCV